MNSNSTSPIRNLVYRHPNANPLERRANTTSTGELTLFAKPVHAAVQQPKNPVGENLS